MFKIESSSLPNGTVLLLGISYPGLIEPSPDATRGRTRPKVFTYVALKAGNLWYFTGGGKAPQAAGWGAVERWLGRDNRVVEWASIVTETDRLYARDAAPIKVPSTVDRPALPTSLEYRAGLRADQ